MLKWKGRHGHDGRLDCSLPSEPGASGVYTISLTLAGMRDLIAAYGPLGPLVSVALMVLHSLVPFPAELVTMTNGVLYGPLWGTVLSWSGAMLGACLAFGIARWGGRPLALRFVPARHLDRFDGWVARYGVGALLVLRLLPLVSFNLVNYAAGLMAVSWWTFLWTTAVGILPMTVLMVVAAHQLGQGNPVGMWLLGALALAGGAAWFIKRRRKETHP